MFSAWRVIQHLSFWEIYAKMHTDKVYGLHLEDIYMNVTKKTIFLVDDDMTNLTIGKKTLSALYNVYTLNSAEVLFEMLEDIQPDLILLDVNMPEMDGYEAIKIIKADEKTAQIPVIFLTALNNEEMELKGFELGAIDYITKPFSPQLLMKRIEVQLMLEQQRQELLQFNNNLTKLVNDKTETVIELKNAMLSTMAELLESRDEITGGHIVRVQNYIKALIDAMNRHDVYKDELSEMDESLILQSCQLHDVGKISVKDSILNKPGRLTPDEFEEIKKHAVFGEKVIGRIIEKTMDSEFLEYARIFAISHHERWDGSGYPLGLSGEDIPLLGRLMAVADVYDALVDARPYKKAYSHEKAVEIMMEGRGSHFDPVLIDLFEEIHLEFKDISEEVK